MNSDKGSDRSNESPREIDNLEVEPLSDEDLESVPGGAYSLPTECSCTETGGNCTS